MGKKLDAREVVSIEEVILAQAIEQEALVNILVKKGLIDRNKLLDEIKVLKEMYMK